MPDGTYLDSALYVSSLESARFSWAGREYLGQVALDGDLEDLLAALELEPEAYGCRLYDAVFPAGGELREGLREAVVAAEQERSRLRFLLHLAPDLPEWVHGLYWELLTDGGRHLALARSPDTAFSRYLGVRRSPGTPATRRPRLLCVIAAPSNSEKFNLAEIRRDEVIQRLQAPFGMLAESVDVAVLEPPATLGRLRERLMADGGFHLLHFFGHGQNRGGASALVMEDDQGRAQFVGEELLTEVFLGVRELRLITLIACHGGAPSSRDPFSGLAGRLVQRGLPAVIAMRREVSVEDAHLFTNHLYGHLVQTGRADAAVNEARQQLYLANPRGIAWSSPVLYSRLTDGRLWLPQEEEAEAEKSAEKRPLFQLSWRRLLHPLPWLPAALALALLVLGLWPAPRAEARFDLWVSRISFQLARNATVIERLRLQEIAATQLAALRLPTLPAPAEWRPAGSGGMKGFLLAVRPNAAPNTQLTLNALPLPAGTRVALDHLGANGDDAPNAYRLSFDGSDEELRVTFQGDVVLKPLDAPPAILHLAAPDSLILYPQSRSLDLDVLLNRFAGDEISPRLPIDGLTLLRIVEHHEAERSTVEEESTLLGGAVSVRATGARHRLKNGESLRFAEIAGSLTGLRLGTDGIRLAFQGRVSKLQRAAEGLQPESLMPSVLDLWLAESAQRVVLAASGVLAVLVLFFTVLNVRLREKESL
jgi:CHAT domain